MTKVIAITGPSGSGKTTIASKLLEQISQQQSAILLSEDNYYKDQSHLTLEQRLETNYDLPQAYEHSLLSEQLKALKRGEKVEAPLYCFKNHTRKEETISLQSPDVIIVEGLMLLTNNELAEEFDVSAYIDTPIDICLLRRINRDIKERGRSVECITDQYLQAVRPSLKGFIEPSAEKAQLKLSDFESDQTLIAHLSSLVSDA